MVFNNHHCHENVHEARFFGVKSHIIKCSSTSWKTSMCQLYATFSWILVATFHLHSTQHRWSANGSRCCSQFSRFNYPRSDGTAMWLIPTLQYFVFWGTKRKTSSLNKSGREKKTKKKHLFQLDPFFEKSPVQPPGFLGVQPPCPPVLLLRPRHG